MVVFRRSISLKCSFSRVHWKTLNSLKTFLILDSFSRESNGEKVAPCNRSFAARVGDVFCKSKFKIIVVSLLRLMKLNLIPIPEANECERCKRYPVWRRHFIMTWYFKPFFFLSVSLHMLVIVCTSNAKHFAWLVVRVVPIKVCTSGVLEISSSLILPFFTVSLPFKVDLQEQERSDFLSSKMELMKENFSFCSRTSSFV